MMAFHVAYRPLVLEDVIGQPQAITALRRMVKEKRAKTYLFSGPSGTGKTTLARIVANSFGASVEEVPAADHTGVDDMRQLITRSHYQALGTGNRAFLLDEAHRLSGAAWDVLLKPIEEPPAHVWWLFCTTNVGKIPKTIQTRCVKFDLKPVKEEDLLGLLVRVADAEGLATKDEVLEAIAEGSEGSPRQALVFLETCADAKSAGEARRIMQSNAASKEAIDLCRFVLKPQGGWGDAVKLVKALEGTDAESARISVVNYLGACLMGAKGNEQAKHLLYLLDCFNEPYRQSERHAPLLRSLGLVMGLDQ